MGRHDGLIDRFAEPERDRARLVLGQLGGDTLDFADLSPSDVRGVLWLHLPGRWQAPRSEWPALAEALARLLELADRPTLAAVAREPVLAEVFAAYARSDADGHETAARAFLRTGTVPPNTDLLAWGSVHAEITDLEVQAYSEAVRLLDAEIAAGAFVPDTPGWRELQAELITRWLTTPAEAFDGETPLTTVRFGRLRRWAGAGPEDRRAFADCSIPLLVPVAEDQQWTPDEEAIGWFGADDVEVAVAEIVTAALLTDDDGDLPESVPRVSLAFIALGPLEAVLLARPHTMSPFRQVEASVLRWMDYGVGRGFLRSDPGREQCTLTDSGRSAGVNALAARAFSPKPAWPWPVSDVSTAEGPV